ncbi:glycosyltransferase family protein [Flavobacterium gilvum]|uniref:Glycosyltransferase subfamily 4-like N-terminal domain-containing protein n=1 Tax=Flavobacterium gilvum TaxID=1492737 RepID=A0AAC9I3S3_9FLAO|nr:hypothetical protein [Flavobacterium gilvum]AOW08153.1 hypothetical protein EM308_00760 [Flavobacterium gilvum]KFC59354.1 hypothetical protein FEM08_19580 [Flavobacterium gilvum]
MFIKNDSSKKPTKVLIICYDFFPEAKPNTYRWFNIVKKWYEEEGIEIHVISGAKNQFKNYEEVDGIKIYRTTEYLIGNLKYKYRNKVQEARVTEKRSLGISLKKIIRVFYDFTWSKLYWPDHSFLWCFSVIPLAKRIIEENKIDKLITVSWTFSAHVIGYNLKRKFNSIFWLADTVDPFSIDKTVNNSFIYNGLNTSFERKIFEKANLNCVLTARIRDKYISIFPNLKNKIVVNNNIFIPSKFDYSKESEFWDKHIKLVFLGTLSEDVRSPKNLLLLFDRMVNKYPDVIFELNFYGEFSKSLIRFNEYPKLLNSSIFLNGFIDKSLVNNVIKEADVLINIGNNNKYQEPSKLIEYMYSGKKILNICSIEEDTSAELLKIYPLNLNVFPEDLKDEDVIEKVYNFLSTDDKVDSEMLDVLLKDFMLQEVSNKYLDFLTNKVYSSI